MPSLAEIADKLSEPIVFAFDDVLQAWSTELDVWIDCMKGLRKLNIERPVIFGRNKLTIRLFTKLYPTHRITACFQIAQLGRSILRSVIKQTYGSQHWQPVRQATLKDSIESDLFHRRIFVGGAVPWIGRGNIDRSLSFVIAGMADLIVKLLLTVHHSHRDLAHCVTEMRTYVA